VLTYINIITRDYRDPAATYSDNGSYFIANPLVLELKGRNIKVMNALLGHPTSVGLVERYMRLIKESL